MKRGEVWTVSGTGYAGKPRPALIVQDDRFPDTDSVTICAFTTDPGEAPLFRLPVSASEANGLKSDCRLMADKVITVPRTRMGKRLGHIGDADMLRLNRAILVFLGLAG